jgi:heat shock protein HslJ
MRRIASLAVLVVSAALVTACGSSSSGSAGLTGKTWTLSTVTQEVPAFQGVVPPAEQGKYTIEFRDDNSFSAKADCNTVQGVYVAGDGGSMTITPGPTTLVACPPGSLGSAYTAALSQTRSYVISNGQLSLTITGGGKLQFS